VAPYQINVFISFSEIV